MFNFSHLDVKYDEKQNTVAERWGYFLKAESTSQKPQCYFMIEYASKGIEACELFNMTQSKMYHMGEYSLGPYIHHMFQPSLITVTTPQTLNTLPLYTHMHTGRTVYVWWCVCVCVRALFYCCATDWLMGHYNLSPLPTQAVWKLPGPPPMRHPWHHETFHCIVVPPTLNVTITNN